MTPISFLECDLETIIYKTPILKLIDHGLQIDEDVILQRQLRLGDYGIIDLFGFRPTNRKDLDNGCISLTIIELKLNEINLQSLLQVSRYLKAAEIMFPMAYVKGVLIGRKIDLKSDFIYVCNQCPQIDLYTYDYGVDGLMFDKVDACDYSIVDQAEALKSCRKNLIESFYHHSFIDDENEPSSTIVIGDSLKKSDDLPF